MADVVEIEKARGTKEVERKAFDHPVLVKLSRGQRKSQ